MIDHIIPNAANPLDDVRIDLGTDRPLHEYVMKAIQDIEVINVIGLHPTNESQDPPFIHVCNWKWNPHPMSEDIKVRRRETGTKLATKTIADTRLGILEFDIFCGARDKNKRIVTEVVHNKIYVPIADENGRYLIEHLYYAEYQLVDKLLYPSGRNSITLKSLLPIVIAYEEAIEHSIDGYVVSSKSGMVKIFKTMEPIISCFMHVPCVLAYLGVHPILQFCDRVHNDKDQWEYFQPIENKDIYIKAYRKGLEKFDYVRSILVMVMAIIRKYDPPSMNEVDDCKWWVYQQSTCEGMLEHRGACHETHVARMLDTISAQVLPIPEIDKRTMIALLRYVLMTEFDDVDIYSYANKRLRLNEVISTIVTAKVSEKLKKLFGYGALLTMKDMLPFLKFQPEIITKEFHNLETHHVVDFDNDLDFAERLRFTKHGPNSLGRLDKHKIKRTHRQLHPSVIGMIDVLQTSKDVGQSGMLSPWADVSAILNSDINKYPNIKYELYDFIRTEFPNPCITFNAKNIEEYNNTLDKLTLMAYMDVDYRIGDQEDETVD